MMGGSPGPANAQGTPSSTEAIPTNLTPPASSVLIFELKAQGVQIYACEADPNDPSTFVWTFKAPEAELLNARGDVVGHHFAGPTWQGQDGSAVVGAVLERADAPVPDAIPWLLLEAMDHAGSGVFSTITHIQRLDTSGGVAPSEGCDEAHSGAETRQPYEATYAFFYPAAAATPSGATAETGSVTLTVFTCPAELSQAAGQGQADLDTLLAGCTTLISPDSAPTLSLLPDGAPMAGMANESGAYHWDDLPFGDYAIGGSGEQPANMSSLLVTDASGIPLQNPVLHLSEASPNVEYHYFYFVNES
jgi:hypothetical protein